MKKVEGQKILELMVDSAHQQLDKSFFLHVVDNSGALAEDASHAFSAKVALALGGGEEGDVHLTGVSGFDSGAVSAGALGRDPAK